jgi:hypothetical protein
MLNLRSSPLTIPQSGLWLGYMGLLPFLAGAGWVIMPGLPFQDIALKSLILYGSVILSFLGGVRWGLAIAKTNSPSARPLIFSVIPSLLGWIAALLEPRIGLLILALAFSSLYVADLRLSSAPAWYKSLRLPLTAGAVLALLVGLVSND